MVIDMQADQVDAIHLVACHGRLARRHAADHVRAATAAGDTGEVRRWRRIRRLVTQ